MPTDHSLNAHIARCIEIRDSAHNAGAGDVLIVNPNDSTKTAYIETVEFEGGTTRITADAE